MTWHQYHFNSNKCPDSVHTPCTFWRDQGHHVNHLKYDFVQSCTVHVLSEGHKHVNAMNIKLLGTHVMVGDPCWESCRHKVHKTGSAILYTYRVLKKIWFLYEMRLTMSIWNDLDVYKSGLPKPPDAISVQNGDC